MKSPILTTKMMASLAAILISILLTQSLTALAADGDRDLGFGAGITFTGIQCHYNDRIDMVLQPDGCILVAGIEADVCVARLLPDGRLDPDFGFGGVARYPILAEDNAGPALALQPDGRILLAVGRTSVAGGNVLIRLLHDGSPDPTFGVGGATPVPFGNSGQSGLSLGVQPDGRIVLAIIDAGTSLHMLARFESLGPLDISYGVDGVASIGIEGSSWGDVDLFVQPDGKAVIAGTDAANSEGFVARWTTGGTRDNTFLVPGLGTIPHTGVSSMGFEIDLDVRIEGGFRFAGHDNVRNFTIGFLDNGAFDTQDGFLNYGPDAVDQGSAVTIGQAGDGIWYLGGMTDDHGPSLGAYVTRQSGDYWQDRAYGHDSLAYTRTETYYQHRMAMKVADDGRVFVAGTEGPGSGIWVVQIDRSGSMHGGFGESRRGWVSLGPKFEKYSGLALIVQPGGMILAAGHSEIRRRNFVTRLYPDGTRDLDFGEDGFVFALPVSRDELSHDTAWPALAVLPDGRFFLAGTDSVFSVPFVSRYSVDGVLDVSYGDGGVARTGLYAYSDVPLALVAQPDGRVVIAAMDLAAQDYYLARFNTIGALDTGFGSGGIIHAGLRPLDDSGVALARQPNGKIVLAGYEMDDGLERLVRFTTNGQPDPTFGVDGIATWGIEGNIQMRPSLAVQSTGGILLACHAEALGEIVVVRYSSTGQVDVTFGTGAIARTGLPTTPFWGTALVQESDGKFLLTAWTETYPQLYTARYTADGILDPSFGVEGIARDSQIQPDAMNVAAVLSPQGGPILLCQDYISEQGLLIHLLSSTLVSHAPDGLTDVDQLIIRSISPNPFNTMTTILLDLPAGSGFSAQVFDVRGRRIRSLAQDEIARRGQTLSWDGRNNNGRLVATGVYFFRLEAGSYSETKRMVLLK